MTAHLKVKKILVDQSFERILQHLKCSNSFCNWRQPRMNDVMIDCCEDKTVQKTRNRGKMNYWNGEVNACLNVLDGRESARSTAAEGREFVFVQYSDVARSKAV